MNQDLWEQLPVYRRLENEVRNHIAKHHLASHALLPSESQLAAEYGVSIGTVRKALNNLMEQKVIYRRHGQGTFVAPRSRKGRILVVPGGLYDADFHSDYFDFLVGALYESNAADLPHEPALVDRRDFFNHLDEVKMIYPELSGVIFFRGYDNLEKAAPALTRQNIPFLFYGPNIYGRTGGGGSTVYHDEAKIASLLAEYFASRKFHRVFEVIGPADIAMKRSELLQEALREQKLDYGREFWNNLEQEPENLRRIAAEYDVITCTTSIVAIQVIQMLERKLRLRVPDAIAVTGIDDFPATYQLQPQLTVVDLCNHENGARCLRKMSEMLSGSRRNFHQFGELRLIVRESS